MSSPITIITAFFDIGRGEWTPKRGFSPHLERTTDTYVRYFENLAKLDNEMVIFTSTDLKPLVEKIRQNKPTKIVCIDIFNKFKNIRKRIAKIQNDPEFLNRLKAEQLKNPEYWSAEYVLVCNLKSYFVNRAINSHLVSSDLAAWIDFGYCRNVEVINGIKEWKYPFDKKKMHLFTIKRGLSTDSLDTVIDYMVNNDVFIIGGALVGSKEKWQEFYQLVSECQNRTLNKNIVDDDQGIFLMCYYFRPDLIKLNYLGKGKWFDLFKRFKKGRMTTFFNSIILYLLMK